ncbi:MAG: hypothetical protein O3A00_20955 [Planctomycetota bacterium]|nr:hypothetical protein [Planctomycetota bacterium]
MVLDEFQWLANEQSNVVADLKLVWDVYISRLPAGIVLFLSGSIASFMLDKVLHSSAFYGRIDTVLHLEPFSLSDTQTFLHRRGHSEVLEAAMLFGRIPKYLELADNAPLKRNGIRQRHPIGAIRRVAIDADFSSAAIGRSL